MKVTELKPGQGKVDIELEIISKDDVRTFNKYGRDLRVCNCMAKDDSGEIKLTLWNDDIDKINVGNIVKISNGYIGEFNGEKQISSGKFGSIEIINAVSKVNPKFSKSEEQISENLSEAEI